MFAIEIEFSDGISLPEVVCVRRSSVILGTSESAHVQIDSSGSSVGDIRVTRGLGRRFTTDVIRRAQDSTEAQRSATLQGEYDGFAEIQFGGVRLSIVALDVDLLLEGDEAPDRAAFRILRQSLLFPSPNFPAVAVLGGTPVLLSFSPRQPILVGRSRSCLVRFDSSDISAEHAKIGCEGGRCWVEDLGSTNGTFVAGEPVVGRRPLDVDDVVTIGGDVNLAVVYRPDDIGRLQNKPVLASRIKDVGIEPRGGAVEHSPPQSARPATPLKHKKYPVIFSKSENVRPSRFVCIQPGKLTVGRDPANDIWINTPHISRDHLQIEWKEDDTLSLIDESSNGTFVNGERLPRQVPYKMARDSHTIDLGGGVFLYFVRDEKDEAAVQEQLRRQEDVGGQDSIENFMKPTSSIYHQDIPATMLKTRHELPVIEDVENEDELADEIDESEYLVPSEEFEAKESEQFQLLEAEEEPLGLGVNFSRALLVLFIGLLLLFGGLVFLGFFADRIL